MADFFLTLFNNSGNTPVIFYSEKSHLFENIILSVTCTLLCNGVGSVSVSGNSPAFISWEHGLQPAWEFLDERKGDRRKNIFRVILVLERFFLSTLHSLSFLLYYGVLFCFLFVFIYFKPKNAEMK